MVVAKPLEFDLGVIDGQDAALPPRIEVALVDVGWGYLAIDTAFGRMPGYRPPGRCLDGCRARNSALTHRAGAPRFFCGNSVEGIRQCKHVGSYSSPRRH